MSKSDENTNFTKMEQIEPSENENTNRIDLEYGDIIQIISPSNDALHEMNFFINYIDEKKVKLVNIISRDYVELNIRENTGGFIDESILKVYLLDRSEEPGYARQKGLLPKTWVDIYFRGFPTITGEITDLEEDRIEITTYPQLKILYIDFHYRGLPENIPIEKFVIREKPLALNQVSSIKKIRQLESIDEEEEDRDEATQTYLPSGESIIYIPDDVQPDANIKDILREKTGTIKSSSVVFGDYLDSMDVYIEVPESKKKYGIEMQISSYMDELLADVPYASRTSKLMNNVHILLERYRELRNMYSDLDATGNIKGLKRKDHTKHKPLVSHLESMDVQLKWILPVSAEKMKYYTMANEATEMQNVIEYNLKDELNAEEQMKRVTYYENNNNVSENKYSSMMAQLNEFMTPYVLYDDNNAFLKTLHVNHPHIESWPENSTTYQALSHGLPFTKMNKEIRGGKHYYLSGPIHSSDEMALTSIIMLPLSSILYSRVGLPSTNILEKSQLGQVSYYPFLGLNKASKLERVVVDDLIHELEHMQKGTNQEELELEKEYQFKYLDQPTKYVLSNEFIEDDHKYRRFLQAVLPNNYVCILFLRKYLKNCFTFTKMVETLEPFMIYQEDISYKQYMQIRYSIKTNIQKLKEELDEKSKQYTNYKHTKYSLTSNQKSPLLYKNLETNKELLNLFLSSYNFPHESRPLPRNVIQDYSNDEVLMQILEIDGGDLYSKLIVSMMASLIVPESLLLPLEPPSKLEDGIEKAESNDCTKRILAKKYEKINDLEKDNGNEDLYVDKELDETNYGLLKKYEKERKEMSAAKFILYFAENLIQKHDCPREKADELAKIIIEGKRKVKEGEYALLETEESNYLYYVRRKNQWILDDNIEPTQFLPSNELFCNIKQGCFKNITIDKTCETAPNAREMFQELEKKQAMRNSLESEFERRYKESRNEIVENIEKVIADKIRKNMRLQIYKQIMLEKSNHLAYAIGESFQSQSNNDPATYVQSPYLKLKYEILSQTDFIKRCIDIVKFTTMFCRDPLVEQRNEDPYWKYCEETNTKLLPSFLYTLAKSYITQGQESYEKQLQQIIAVQGIEEDGIIYDKYSDEIIQKIDFVLEETYNEQGFRVVTHSMVDKEDTLEIMKSLNQNDAMVFENALAQDIYTVYTGIHQYLSDFTNEMKEQTLQLANEIAEKEIPKEEIYNREIKKIMDKNPGKKPVSFKSMRNKKIIQSVVASMLIVIQTSIPTYKSSKIFPGCILSFQGYPLKSEENTKGIQFFACILNQISNDFEPWNSIYKNSQSTLANQLLEFLKKLMKTSRIEKMYEKKWNYLKSNPEEEIPEQLSVTMWKQFLPPLFDFQCSKKIQHLPSGFIQEFWSLSSKGHSDQTKHYYIIHNKMKNYGYSIIENIQDIVSKKELVLKSASRVPYIQNACCNEMEVKEHHHPILYFGKQASTGASLLDALKISIELSKELHKIHLASVAPVLSYPMKYKRAPLLAQNIHENNIYHAMIVYCGLDKDEIPSEMMGFFSKVPEKYNAQSSLMEKIQLLKETKKFGMDELHELMYIVRKRNMITLKTNREPELLELFKEKVAEFEKHENHENNLMESKKKIMDLLYTLAKEYVPNKYYSNDETSLLQIQQLDALKNELVKSNKILYNEIMFFLEKYQSLNNKQMEKIETFLSKIGQWNNQESVYEILQFFKNAMYDLAVYLPAWLVNNYVSVGNGTNYKENKRLHKYWELSNSDYLDIQKYVKQYYNEIHEFKGDSAMVELIQKTMPHAFKIYSFFKETPVFSPLKKGDKTYFQMMDKETIFMLAQYCMMSLMFEYIRASDDIHVKHLHHENEKQKRRNEIAEKTDVFQSIPVGENIENVEKDEMTEIYENLLEVQIEMGEKNELNKNVAKFLMVFMNMHMKNKSILNYSYENIEKKQLSNTTKEKERIMKEKKKMKPEQRKIDNLHQKYSLGKWNVGLQKGIFKYDKETSDRERNENILQNIRDDEEQEDNEDFVQQINESPILYENTEDFDAEIEKQAKRDEINEMYDFRMGSEDYMNGNVYDEDRNDEYLE